MKAYFVQEFLSFSRIFAYKLESFLYEIASFLHQQIESFCYNFEMLLRVSQKYRLLLFNKAFKIPCCFFNAVSAFPTNRRYLLSRFRRNSSRSEPLSVATFHNPKIPMLCLLLQKNSPFLNFLLIQKYKSFHE